MIAIQIILVVACSAGLLWAMIAWMTRANRREREMIERRRAEWIANGSDPDTEPRFEIGSGGGSGAY